MQPRTKRQKEVLDYITQFVDRNGYEPSYQQIARQLGVRSKGGIQRHIMALEGQGLILRRRVNGSFGIELPARKIDPGTGTNFEITELEEADGNFVETHSWTTFLPKFITGDTPASDIFGLKMPDDSLADKHICEGDVLVFERRSYGSRGEIVAVRLVKDRLAIGQYYHHGRETEIRPANSDFESKMFEADKISILGVLRGLIRPPADFSE